ncbi:MAG: hypothetical protein LBK73_13585 [Treponema sp.]|jgi:hypothetical protein|nr:hypothetical protein [Treponema sp.]
MAKEAFEQSNGFSALTADELFFVNGGSSGGGWEGVAGGLYAMGTLTPAGLIGGAMFVGIGAGIGHQYGRGQWLGQNTSRYY